MYAKGDMMIHSTNYITAGILILAYYYNIHTLYNAAASMMIGTGLCHILYDYYKLKQKQKELDELIQLDKKLDNIIEKLRQDSLYQPNIPPVNEKTYDNRLYQ